LIFKYLFISFLFLVICISHTYGEEKVKSFKKYNKITKVSKLIIENKESELKYTVFDDPHKLDEVLILNEENIVERLLSKKSILITFHNRHKKSTKVRMQGNLILINPDKRETQGIRKFYKGKARKILKDIKQIRKTLVSGSKRKKSELLKKITGEENKDFFCSKEANYLFFLKYVMESKNSTLVKCVELK